MRSLFFDKTLQYRPNSPIPVPPPGEALIKTRLAGVCNTDLEIIRGYMNFRGILGHEFVGDVVQADDAPQWVGRRVVGEINAFCGKCVACRRGDQTQCLRRNTLGIDRRNGVMADYFTLPIKLLYALPDSISDSAAVFTEPLAAACEITNQLHIRPTDRVIVLGDGKLGLLIAQVLQLTGCDLLAVGRHTEKLDILSRRGIPVSTDGEELKSGADVVVEATGSPEGFATARRLVRPRGTLVLKSTFHSDISLNLSMVVVDEVKIVGSRCGPFAVALRLLQQQLVDVAPLIHNYFSLDDALVAFKRAGEPGVLKVLLSMGDDS